MHGLTRIMLGLSTISLVASCSSMAVAPSAPQIGTDRDAARYQLLTAIPECPATCIAVTGASQFTDTSSLNYDAVDQGANDLARIIVEHGGVTYFGGSAFGTTVTVALTDPNTDPTPEVHLQGTLRDGSGNEVTFQYDFAVDPTIPLAGFGYGTVIIGTDTFTDREGAATFTPDLCELPGAG